MTQRSGHIGNAVGDTIDRDRSRTCTSTTSSYYKSK